jgi:hypothetical protein
VGTGSPRRGAGGVCRPPGPSREQELEGKIAALEAKLAGKDAIIAEVSEEYVKLRKELGEP